MKTKYLILLLLSTFFITSCHRGEMDADDIPQEDLSDILLKVTDITTNQTATYDYQVNSATLPNVKLQSGHTYDVAVIFLNGNEDATEEIIQAKDEHFLVYNFIGADINLTRTDSAESTRADGARVGLKTRWTVNSVAATGSQLILTLYHEPATVSEEKNGSEWGKQTGGETDAQGTFNLSNL